MSIVINKAEKKKYEIPDEGLYKAVLADIIDIGEVDTQFGKKHRVRFIYFLEDCDKDGKQFRLMQQLNASLHEKSGMYKVIRRLMGKEIGDVKSFDLDVLIGKQCQLDVQHTEKEGETYANVMSVLANQKGQNVKVPADFVRSINRDKEPAKSTAVPKEATGVSVTPQSDTVNL